MTIKLYRFMTRHWSRAQEVFSKYTPHQGAREKARRVRQRDGRQTPATK